MSRWMKATGVFLVGLVPISLPATVSPPAAKGIDVLSVYAGTWTVEIEHFDTAHSKAGHEKTQLRNACWKDGGYFVCNQYVDGESKALIVFTYNAKENVYKSYPIPVDGGEPSSGKLFVDGRVWTFPWEVTEDGKKTYYRVVNVFDSPDRIEYRQEFSPDNLHWTTTAKGRESKTAAE